MKNLPPKKTRTIFLKGVKQPTLTMLKSGGNNKKLGSKVKVKMWKNMPLFSLTLEERATCPATCEQWDNCYGNNMPFAHRYDHNHQDFLPNLENQIIQLNNKHAAGFVVRLHVLGDFYSKHYIKEWEKYLNKYSGLRAFGYTHHKLLSPLGQQIHQLNTKYPDRFRVRFSDDTTVDFTAVTEKTDTGVKGIYCPEQQGKTSSCATCGYCWASDKPVIFIEH